MIADVDVVASALADRGFAVLSAEIDPNETSALRAECDAHIDAAETAPDASVFTLNDRAFRVNDLVTRPRLGDSVLALRAHPSLLRVGATHIGSDFVPYGSVLVYKTPEQGPAVPMHSDLAAGHFDVEHRWLAVGVYLDEADVDNGCLWVVPGSHRWPEDRRAAAIAAGFTDAAGAVPVPAAPGDLVFHDARLLHGSDVSRSTRPRRVLYFSFQSAAWILSEGVTSRFRSDRRWVAKNLQLLEEGRSLRATADRMSFAWQCPAEWEGDVCDARQLGRETSVIH